MSSAGVFAVWRSALGSMNLGSFCGDRMKGVLRQRAADYYSVCVCGGGVGKRDYIEK
jgi:hypothetical protein